MTLARFQDARDFGAAVDRCLSASQPISSIQHLFGRDKEMRVVEEALCASGRHVFLYGDRGVGKSSLAATAATQFQSSDAKFLHVGCGPETTFARTIDDIARSILRRAGSKEIYKLDVSVNVAFFALKVAGQDREIAIPPVASPQQAVDVIEQVAQIHSKVPVIVIDEFDQIADPIERKKFATFLKLLGDHGVNVKFIFTGVGSSMEQLIVDHQSSYRQLQPIEVTKLNWTAREEIVRAAVEEFGLQAHETVVYTIAKLSTGFPYYVHLLTEKLLWEAFRAPYEVAQLDENLFAVALQAAIEATAPHHKRPYEKATHHRGEWHEIVWATADSETTIRRTDDIYLSYLRIHEQLHGKQPSPERQPLPQNKVVESLAKLKDDNYGRILESPDRKKGYYAYRENILRGYVAMRALEQGIELRGDEPDAPRILTAMTRERRLYSAGKSHIPHGVKFKGEKR